MNKDTAFPSDALPIVKLERTTPMTKGELQQAAQAIIRAIKFKIKTEIEPRREDLFNAFVELGHKEIRAKIAALASNPDASISSLICGDPGIFHQRIIDGGPIAIRLFGSCDEFENQVEYTDLMQQLKRLEADERKIRIVTKANSTKTVDLAGNLAFLVEYLEEKDKLRLLKKLESAEATLTEEQQAELAKKAMELLNS